MSPNLLFHPVPHIPEAAARIADGKVGHPPLVCIDESSKQQVLEARKPIEAEPDQIERYDYEYERNGASNLFMLFAPFEGWRHVKVTDRRTKVDFAYCIKDLLTIYYPDAQRVTIVMDNLNTHHPASLYETFEL